jgi:hypothetical protein
MFRWRHPSKFWMFDGGGHRLNNLGRLTVRLSPQFFESAFILIHESGPPIGTSDLM